jgi:cation diffusion facilitator family transporter
MNKVFKVIITSFIGNVILIILKFVVGTITNTMTLIADGVHSLSDLSTDVIAFVGEKLCMKESDEKHPKGHGRIEYITSMIIGVAVIIVAISLVIEAFNSQVTDMNNIIIFVVIISIVGKYFLSKYVYEAGIKYKNNILISSGLESKADYVSSIAVLIILLLSNLTPYIPFFKYSDKIGTILVSLFIFKTGILILRSNISLIVGESERDECTIKNVKEEILKIEEVKKVDEVSLIKYGSYYDAAIRISLDADLKLIESHEITTKVRKRLLKSDLKIKYVIIHTNPYKK